MFPSPWREVRKFNKIDESQYLCLEGQPTEIDCTFVTHFGRGHTAIENHFTNKKRTERYNWLRFGFYGY